MFKITLAEGYHVATMLAVVLGAAALTALFYRRAFRTLRPLQWQGLLLLRWTAIAMVALLLFRPVFSYYKETEERPSLAFLLDTSASMSIADDATGVTRFNQARTQLEKWSGKLQRDFDLHLVEFAEQARPLDGVKALSGLSAAGKATSLVRALEAGAAQAPKSKTTAIILLSDGVNNCVGNPVEAAARLGVPVHAVGVGACLHDNLACRNVQVVGIDCPDRLLLKNLARVAASIEGIGLAGRVVNVVLEEDGRQIGQQELTLEPGRRAASRWFSSSARRPRAGTPTPFACRRFLRRRSWKTISVLAARMVVEPGIRLLYLEGTLRAEYGALVEHVLAKDPDLEFCALVQTRPNVFLKRSNMRGLKLAAIPADQESADKFDVFILGDLDSSYLRPQQQEMLLKRVRQGAGLLMLGGYHSLGPGGYGQTPLGQALPAILGGKDIGQATDAFWPVLTPEGDRHPIFANIGEFFPTQAGDAKTAGLPALDGCTRGRQGAARRHGAGNALPRAELDAPVGRAAARPRPHGGLLRRHHPQLAASPAGDGPGFALLAVLGADDSLAGRPGGGSQRRRFDRRLGRQGELRTWRADPHFGHRSRQARAGGRRRESDGEDPRPRRTARANRIDRRARARRALRAEHSSRKRPAATKSPSKPRRANCRSWPTSWPSRWAESISNSRSSTSTRRRWGRSPAAAGGRYVHIATADRLIDQLDRSQRKKRIYIERQLYWPPACWAVLVAVLTLEWHLRRRYQLR